MGLTLNQETSHRVSEVVLPPRMGRNETCHCGSGIKYKRCCWERDEALRRQLRGAALPEWIDGSRSKLHQFEKYVSNVFGLPDLLASLVDTRRAPKFTACREFRPYQPACLWHANRRSRRCAFLVGKHIGV